MATSSNEMKTKVSWRRYKDGQQDWGNLTQKIFVQDTSHKCPTYVHKTPPCQGSCPSGEDIRGWLAIVRQQEKPPVGHHIPDTGKRGEDRYDEHQAIRTDDEPFVRDGRGHDLINADDLKKFVGGVTAHSRAPENEPHYNDDD